SGAIASDWSATRSGRAAGSDLDCGTARAGADDGRGAVFRSHRASAETGSIFPSEVVWIRREAIAFCTARKETPLCKAYFRRLSGSTVSASVSPAELACMSRQME